MIITLLCIAFCSDLSLDGLNLHILFNWYCIHPFMFILAIMEIISEAKVSEVSIKKD